MTAPDLLMYGATSKHNYDVIHVYLRHRADMLIRPFCPNPAAFFQLLRSTNSAVSGSIAYAYVTPAELGGWSPDNLDLFVRKQALPIVIHFLESFGYKSIKRTPAELAEASLFGVLRGNFAFDVQQLRRGDSHINIIPCPYIPIAPIFESHSTITMNFFTGFGFYSAYPLLTANQRSVINPNFWMLLERTAQTGIDNCITKYTQRGVEMQLTPAAWSKDSHMCTLSTRCPHTVRSLTDGHGLYIDLRVTNSSTLRPRDGERTVFDDAYTVAWCLGGKPCNTRKRCPRPFVMVQYVDTQLFWDD